MGQEAASTDQFEKKKTDEEPGVHCVVLLEGGVDSQFSESGEEELGVHCEERCGKEEQGGCRGEGGPSCRLSVLC
ncbi:unnamed protein product [Arctogadus glacialis]